MTQANYFKALAARLDSADMNSRAAVAVRKCASESVEDFIFLEDLVVPASKTAITAFHEALSRYSK